MKKNSGFLSLLAICLIWGTTYLFLKIGVAQVPPFYFAAIRQLCAGLILLAGLIFIGKKKLPDPKTLRNQAIAGILLITIGNGFVSYGEVHVSSSLAAVICSSMPVWIALLNEFRKNGLRLSGLGYFAILLGLMGIIGIFSDSFSFTAHKENTFGIILILIATFGWIGGSIISKNAPTGSNPFVLSAIQMISGGFVLLLISLFTEHNFSLSLDQTGWFSLFYLILFGSIIGMAAYAHALSKLPLQIVSVYAYINPVVAIIVGWIFLHEKLTWQILICCLMIILSVILLNLPFARRKPVSV